MNRSEQRLAELAERRDELEAQLDELRDDLRAAVDSADDLPMTRIAEILGISRQRAYVLASSKRS